MALIHSVDSENILLEINKQAAKINKIQQVLLQISIADEVTKFGFEEAELFNLLVKYKNHEFPNIEIVGLMGMATFTENQIQIKKEFEHLKSIFDQLKNLKTLSMGMSGDYQLAIECGSTMVRIGSSIFGGR